jgi:CubicO group peptidase (beta-lactamase class C family)/D-alanyl-D-alanine dipeptidase
MNRATVRSGLFAFFVLASLTTSALAQPSIPAAKGYEEAARALDAFIRAEVENKQLPAVSIALIDDQKIVWAHGFGFADAAKKNKATAETVYRVGSVSKLFTDVAVMQLVERGALDLDVPITKFLPDFKPINPFGKAVTLRQLMSHRAGLVREPPVGNYIDDSELSLKRMVESLNRTELVYEPETRIKYSNAGVSVVGFTLEETQKQPFARYLSRTLLQPLGMNSSSFEPDPAVTRNLAEAVMWNYHGREFPAPTFQVGIAPAASMYSTVLDLGRFVSVVLAGGKGPGGVMVKPETLEQMFKAQFAKPGDKSGFGLGFQVQEFEGRRRLGHNGAMYGFATELAFLPEDKLGVVVVASRDYSNAVVQRFADVALGQMRAVKEKKPLPAIAVSTPLTPEFLAGKAGRYRLGERTIDLIERDGKQLYALPASGGFLVEVRKGVGGLQVDDRLQYGPLLTEPKADAIGVGKDVFQRVPIEKPKPRPAQWAGLIGEYGPDYNTLFILEKDGKLHVLIEWFGLYPLKEESEKVFKFPEYGLYHDEKLIFKRDRTGRATEVEAASVVFVRRKLDGENGETFKIKAVKPIEELRKTALAAKPPEEKGDFRKPDLVDLTVLDPTIKLDVRYATDNNFMNTPFYLSSRAFMQRPAAEAVVRVHKTLEKDGYGVVIFDAYRPWAVTKMFWDGTPEKFHMFVADPAKGSRHNRGCAVDLTLFDRKTGKAVEMVGGYDEMSDRSYSFYLGGTSLQRWHRDLLRRSMQAEGFSVYEAEWWHFDYKDWRRYPILNLTFEQLEANPKK